MHTKTYPNLSCMVWQRCTYEPNYQTSTMLTCVISLQQSISTHHGLRKWRSSWANEFLGVMTKGEVVKKTRKQFYPPCISTLREFNLWVSIYKYTYSFHIQNTWLNVTICRRQYERRQKGKTMKVLLKLSCSLLDKIAWIITSENKIRWEK